MGLVDTAKQTFQALQQKAAPYYEPAKKKLFKELKGAVGAAGDIAGHTTGRTVEEASKHFGTIGSNTGIGINKAVGESTKNLAIKGGLGLTALTGIPYMGYKSFGWLTNPPERKTVRAADLAKLMQAKAYMVQAQSKARTDQFNSIMAARAAYPELFNQSTPPNAPLGVKTGNDKISIADRAVANYEFYKIGSL